MYGTALYLFNAIITGFVRNISWNTQYTAKWGHKFLRQDQDSFNIQYSVNTIPPLRLWFSSEGSLHQVAEPGLLDVCLVGLELCDLVSDPVLPRIRVFFLKLRLRLLRCENVELEECLRSLGRFPRRLLLGERVFLIPGPEISGNLRYCAWAGLSPGLVLARPYGSVRWTCLRLSDMEEREWAKEGS